MKIHLKTKKPGLSVQRSTQGWPGHIAEQLTSE